MYQFVGRTSQLLSDVSIPRLAVFHVLSSGQWILNRTPQILASSRSRFTKAVALFSNRLILMKMWSRLSDGQVTRESSLPQEFGAGAGRGLANCRPMTSPTNTNFSLICNNQLQAIAPK